MTKSYDVAIIGAGSAGLTALREVRKQTDNFVLINEGPYGSTCARAGCMPSKALIEAANAFHRRKSLDAFGVSGAERLTVDIPAVLRRVRRLRDGFVEGMLKLTDDLQDRSIAGRARFLEPQVLDVGERRLHAKKIIIATGSRPVVPKEWAALGARMLTSDDLFDQETLPSNMAIIGMGGLGSEIAQSLARLGIEVTGFDAADYIAGLSDPHVNKLAVALLRAEFTLQLGLAAEPVIEGERIRVRAGGESVLVDKVLVALGRRPNVDQMGIENLGVELDEHGVPPFNSRTMQIADLPVYIAGDANRHLPLLHEALDEGYIAGYNALRNQPVCFERRVPLAIVFTDPGIAVIGQAFDELNENETVIGEVDFSSQARARMAEVNYGLLRVYADRNSGRLTGAEMCAPQGEHLAHLLALAVQRKLTVRELLSMPFYHPVLEEGLRTALRDAAGKLGDADVADLACCDRPGADAL
ncbi:MAG: dihydrolipoyl dehydrogenase [Gallionella sp.]|nr:dihydrolipoyl dehydrogenase [Gallionella sp.]